jgi:hypothetical protein
MSMPDNELDSFLKYKWEFCRRDPEVKVRWAKLKELRVPTGRTNDLYYSDGKIMKPPETDKEVELFSGAGIPWIDPQMSFEDIHNLKIHNVFYYTKLKFILKISFLNNIKLIRKSTGIEFNNNAEPLTALLRIDFSKPVNPNVLKEEFSDIVDTFMKAREFIESGLVDTIGQDKEDIYIKKPLDSKVSKSIKDYIKAVYNDATDGLPSLIIRNAVKNRDNINIVSDKVETEDFDKILRSGDMYYQFDGTQYIPTGVTGRDVAKKLFPDDFANNWDGKPDAKVARISQLNDLYLKLVCGGWRSLIPGPKPKKRRGKSRGRTAK